jgi:hypothetical protein
MLALPDDEEALRGVSSDFCIGLRGRYFDLGDFFFVIAKMV